MINLNTVNFNLLKSGICCVYFYLGISLACSAQGISDLVNKNVNENYKNKERKVTKSNEAPSVLLPSYDPVKEGKVRYVSPEEDFFSPDYIVNVPSNVVPEPLNIPDNERMIDTVKYLARSSPIRDEILNSPRKFIHNIIYKKKHSLQKDFKVFGWHPYWMKDAYKSYNFTLLSHVVYHAYLINATNGEAKNSLEDWNSSSLIKLAQKQNPDCKILLGLRIHQDDQVSTFLTNSRAQNTCIQNTIDLILDKQAQGIHLDLENVRENNKEDMMNFIINLSFRLKNQVPEAMLSLSLPVVDPDKVFTVSQLTQYVDLFVLTGLEYYGENSDFAGPIAPIQGGAFWWQYSLEQAVTDYLAAGLEPQKLLLTVPYYGNEWITEDFKVPSSVKKYRKHWMYRDLISLNTVQNNTKQEPQSQSSYIAFPDANSNIRQLWFEDTTSLNLKYTWIKNNKIGGVAIWALGYDNGRTELWELLAKHFAADPEKKSRGLFGFISVSRLRGFVRSLSQIIIDPSVLLRRPSLLLRLLGMFGLLGGTGMAGFLILYRYGCRMKRSHSFLLRSGTGLVMLISFIMIVMFAYNAPYGSLSILGWLFALLNLLGLLYLLFTRQFSRPKSVELP